MKQEKNYKMYRNHLKKITGPCVPFLPVYLSDFTFADDGNVDTRNAMINFNKHLLFAEKITEIEIHQEAVYTDNEEDHTITGYLNSLPQMTKKEAYEKSLLCEPRKSN